jgi:tetratricopeptide (TPR) repeat protein
MHRNNLISVIALLALAPVAYAIPDADGNLVDPGAATDLSDDSAMKARLNYNLGYEGWQKATELENGGAKLTGENALRNQEAVRSGFAQAREKFRTAVGAAPDMKEGWNMLGFTSRKLGDYEESLKAYDKALALAPDYPEAIEYRAELFLLTGRVAQVKEAYATLLKSSPSYAGVLKTSMRDWVKAKKTAAGLAEAERAEFAAWVAKL